VTESPAVTRSVRPSLRREGFSADPPVLRRPLGGRRTYNGKERKVDEQNCILRLVEALEKTGVKRVLRVVGALAKRLY